MEARFVPDARATTPKAAELCVRNFIIRERERERERGTEKDLNLEQEN
jgi:hypothetical protein